MRTDMCARLPGVTGSPTMRRTTGIVGVGDCGSVAVTDGDGVEVSVTDTVAVGAVATVVGVGDGGVNAAVAVAVGDPGAGAYVNGYSNVSERPSQLRALMRITAAPGWRSPPAPPTAR
jgi:hypothetical protein